MARYFVALLPPQAIQQQVIRLQEHFAATYGSRAALRSPPHITLQPPFERPPEALPELCDALGRFARGEQPLMVRLAGFAAFAPRVIYIDVERSPALIALAKALAEAWARPLGLPVETRPFVPHMTVAFRDLGRGPFREAWSVFREQQIAFEFEAKALTLLVHDGRRWQPERDFELGTASCVG